MTAVAVLTEEQISQLFALALEPLRVLLGHSSTLVSLRYAHLAPQDLAVADVGRLAVDLGQRTGSVARHRISRNSKNPRS